MTTMRWILRSPWLLAALLVGAVALAVDWWGPAWITPWLVGGFAVLVAGWNAIDMVRALLNKHVGLDVLAVTAILATVAVGEYWASLIIVIMLTGGEALEDAAAHRAQRDLRFLLDRVPERAHRIDTDGVLRDIPVDQVQVGDRLLIRPSEIVPVDGVLTSDLGQFDESSLTGESVPVDHVRGDTVLSGSLNGSLAVELTATRIAAESEYQRIVTLVEAAASSKAPLVRLADRYAVPFTGLAYAIAGLAWWVSGDPVRFAEVLVVATPCPLLIAAPVAFMGGMSRAARHGIVVKDAGTLERLAGVKTVAFDKTGTLTHGSPEVVRVVPADVNVDADELLRLVASAERYSTHVLARAMQEAALERGLDLLDAQTAEEILTHGVIARFDGTEVVVGKPRFVAEYAPDVAVPTPKPGEMMVAVSLNGVFAGVIILRDRLRGEAPVTMNRLRSLGVQRTVMVTGDLEPTARHIAEDVGVAEVHAECLPEDKVRIIGSLLPKRVMMVGDGVNDAPVLAASDVGVAMGARGSTAASESADVVILLDDLEKAADAIDIGSRTIRIALQSIWLGIIISVGLMLLAAAGFLPAVFGALLQEVVDLIAILGALRAVSDGRSARTTSVERAQELVSTP